MLWCTTKKLSANPYHVLGLPRRKSNGLDYSLQELRTAFYAKAKEVHPDAGGSAEQFRELRQAYDTVRSEYTQNFAATGNNNQYYNNNVNSMYANIGFYNHPHAQWSRAQYKRKEERENSDNDSNSHYNYQYEYWSKSESEWMKRYAQKCENDNERFYAKQRDAEQQRMEKEWQDYKTAWNDLNSQDYKSSKYRRRRQHRENKEHCYNEEYEQWFRSAPQYANYSSWYFYRPYSTHVNEEYCKGEYKSSQGTENNEFDSSKSNNRREFYEHLEREWAESELRRKTRYYYYNEREERSWVQSLVKYIVLCIGVASVYYSCNKQKEFATLQKEEKEQRRREYMYNYYKLHNTHKEEVEYKGHHTSSHSMNDHNIDSERMRRLERYRSSPQTVPHVIRYQGRPFTPDGVRAGKNNAVKTAATFEADKTYELYDDDNEWKDNNRHFMLENRKQEDKSGLLSRGEDDKNSESNKVTVKVAN